MFYVYILTNWNNSVLYIGFTNNINRRLYEHKTKANEGFTSKYNINKLVYYEEYKTANEAIYREKQLKGITRERKNELITSFNPQWIDIYSQWNNPTPQQ